MSDFLMGLIGALGEAQKADLRLSSNVIDAREPDARKGFEVSQDLSPTAKSLELVTGLTNLLGVGPSPEEHKAGVALGFGDLFATAQNDINKRKAEMRTRIPTQAGSSDEDWINSTEGQIWKSSPGMKQAWDAYRDSKQARGAFKK